MSANEGGAPDCRGQRHNCSSVGSLIATVRRRPAVRTSADRAAVRCLATVLGKSDGLSSADFDRLVGVLAGGYCDIKLSGPYRIGGDKPLSTVEPLGRALIAARPDRLIWGSDCPHLPDCQRDTGEVLNLLGDWAPSQADREQILVRTPEALFFAEP